MSRHDLEPKPDSIDVVRAPAFVLQGYTLPEPFEPAKKSESHAPLW